MRQVEGYRFRHDQPSIVLSLAGLVFSFAKSLVAEIQSAFAACSAAASKLIAALSRAGLHAARLIYKSVVSDGVRSLPPPSCSREFLFFS